MTPLPIPATVPLRFSSDRPGTLAVAAATGRVRAGVATITVTLGRLHASAPFAVR